MRRGYRRAQWCPSSTDIPVHGPIDCQLVAPHLGRQHFHAVPGEPDRFWFWSDEPKPTACVVCLRVGCEGGCL